MLKDSKENVFLVNKNKKAQQTKSQMEILELKKKKSETIDWIHLTAD